MALSASAKTSWCVQAMEAPVEDSGVVEVMAGGDGDEPCSEETVNQIIQVSSVGAGDILSTLGKAF